MTTFHEDLLELNHVHRQLEEGLGRLQELIRHREEYLRQWTKYMAWLQDEDARHQAEELKLEQDVEAAKRWQEAESLTRYIEKRKILKLTSQPLK